MKREHDQEISFRKHPLQPVRQATSRGGLKALLTTGIIAVGTILIVAAGPAKGQPPGATPADQATRVTAVAAEVKTAFQLLQGRWLRPDGGYVIEVKAIDDSGKIEAAYLNPKPIHVSKAQATQEGTVTKVFIELRDTGYPGSTYTLTYDPQSDQLKGIYFQAAMQQSFEVFFVRMK
jgi:hypothetical protein